MSRKSSAAQACKATARRTPRHERNCSRMVVRQEVALSRWIIASVTLMTLIVQNRTLFVARHPDLVSSAVGQERASAPHKLCPLLAEADIGLTGTLGEAWYGSLVMSGGSHEALYRRAGPKPD